MTELPAKKTTYGIIGCGRFGALWASRISQYGDVRVYDAHPERAEQLAREAMVQPATLAEVCATDVLFVIVPIKEFENVCTETAPLVRADTLVVDMCAVKMHPQKVMRRVFAATQPYVGMHALFGPDSVARLGLAGRKIVVCAGRSEKANYLAVIALLRSLELAVIEATPREHDMAMAKSHALVHFIGRGLAGLKLQEQEIVTPDYETLLRMQTMVVNDTWQLFYDMQSYNPFAHAQRNAFLSSLSAIEKQLEGGVD